MNKRLSTLSGNLKTIKSMSFNGFSDEKMVIVRKRKQFGFPKLKKSKKVILKNINTWKQ